VNAVVKERLAGEVGAPFEGEQEGESPAFRAGKGQGFPTSKMMHPKVRKLQILPDGLVPRSS